MKKTAACILLGLNLLLLTGCETTAPGSSPAPSRTDAVTFYDGSSADRSSLVMDVAYQFPEWDEVQGFNLKYAYGPAENETVELRINDGKDTFGALLDAHAGELADDDIIADMEYINMLGFNAVSVTEDTLEYETKHTFSRREVFIEQAESFDMSYFLDTPTVNGSPVDDLDAMVQTLGRPRFAAVAWITDTQYSVAYYWDMGRDRYLTILPSGALRFQSEEFLLHNRPMFEPFLKS